MKNTRKPFLLSITLVCILAFTVSFMAGCGQPAGNQTQTNKPDSSGSSEPAKSTNEEKPEIMEEEPLKMTMMNIFFDSEPPKDDAPVIKAIKEFTNFDLDITWVPSAAYADKVNVTIASNELPNVITVTVNKSPNIISAVRAGMFWEVGPYLDEFPNLGNELSDIVFNNISVDGKIYALYRARAMARTGYVVRKDWMENLGLDEPKTVDDLYSMLKAFTEDDPDKNGKDDTFGLTTGIPNYNFITTALGGPNGWGLMDGKLMPSYMFPEDMEALKFFKKLYDEQLMNQDFAIVAGPQRDAFVVEGKAGAFIGVADDASHPRFSEVSNLFPGALLVPGASLEGPAGKKIPAGSGYSGVFMFPKPSVKTEEDLKKCLTFFDRMGELEILNLLEWGIEGEHYAMVNGIPEIQSAEQQERFAREVNPFRQMNIYEYTKTMKGNLQPVQIEVQKYYEDNLPNVVPNLIEPYISNTQSERGAELDLIINDARVKFILGEIDEAGFDQEVERWRKNGGDKIIEEYNAEYQKSQN